MGHGCRWGLTVARRTLAARPAPFPPGRCRQLRGCPRQPVRPRAPLVTRGTGAGEAGHHRVAPGARSLTWCLTGKPRKMMLDTRPGYGPGRPAVPRRLSPGTAGDVALARRVGAGRGGAEHDT